MSSFHFGDMAIDRARGLGHCFCLGLDPHLSMVPPVFRCGDMSPNAPSSIGAVEDFLTAVIDQTADRVVAYKPQSALYERLGSAGIALLERLVDYAHARGSLVLLDAKRGDIESTAEAYAEAYLAPDSPNPVDALTINPYMGLDTIEPYLRLSRRFGKGVFIVLRTSNPGAAAFQDLQVGDETVYETIATGLQPLTEALAGATGWSSLGVVVGATVPEEATRIRALLPKAIFLLPGYGHQGGDVARITAALVPGPAGIREGGLISSSRATLFPAGASTGSISTWRAAFTDQFDRDVDSVAASLRDVAHGFVGV